MTVEDAHQTPEEEHLADQERLLAGLSEQLISKETEFATTGAEFARFREAYLRRFAPLYRELDDLEAQIARLLALEEGTPEANEKAESAKQRAAESEEAARLAEESAASAPSEELLRSVDPDTTQRWTPTMPYSRGDVVLVPFPYTDNSTFKQRPALVVQSDSLITGFQKRVMAQITHEPRIGSSRVQVKMASVEGKAMGLLTDSSLVIDKLEMLSDTEVIKTIGRCPPHTMALVDDALRATFDL